MLLTLQTLSTLDFLLLHLLSDLFLLLDLFQERILLGVRRKLFELCTVHSFVEDKLIFYVGKQFKPFPLLLVLTSVAVTVVFAPYIQISTILICCRFLMSRGTHWLVILPASGALYLGKAGSWHGT